MKWKSISLSRSPVSSCKRDLSPRHVSFLYLVISTEGEWERESVSPLNVNLC